MKDYKRKYQAEWMSSDIKPSKKIKKKIQGSIRETGKKLVRKELKNGDDSKE